jgi:hypothetical protein
MRLRVLALDVRMRRVDDFAIDHIDLVAVLQFGPGFVARLELDFALRAERGNHLLREDVAVLVAILDAGFVAWDQRRRVVGDSRVT